MRPAWLSLLAIASTGCVQIGFSTSVRGETVVAGSPLGGLLSAFPAQLTGFSNIDFDQNQDFQNNDARREHVKSMRVKRLRLAVLAPASQDLSFLDSLEFFVGADGSEQKIAGSTGIGGKASAAPNAAIDLEVVDADLSAYVRAAAVTISSRGSGRQPGQDTRLEATIDFDVGVGL